LVNIISLFLQLFLARNKDNIYLSAFLSRLFPLAVFPLYNIFFIWKYGATLGKKWLKIKVVSIDSQPLSLGQVILRETIGKFLSGLILQLGYLWALWDKNRQTWHDKLAKTYVVTSIPNNGKTPWWQFLVLILPILAVIAVMAAIVVLVVNPLELTRRGRDSARVSDLTQIRVAIEIAQSQNPSVDLCSGSVVPCEGRSNVLNSNTIDGGGWVRVDLSNVEITPKLVSLPVDPINTSDYYYHYCFDGIGWELDTELESSQNKLKMQDDGGDNPSLYEIGTNLMACQTQE
jgi:uncharacterized RDD family membrane protein YckC